MWREKQVGDYYMLCRQAKGAAVLHGEKKEVVRVKCGCFYRSYVNDKYQTFL